MSISSAPRPQALELRSFAFELVFRFPPGIEEFTDEMADRLYQSGCNDALVGIHCGVPYIAFTRDSTSFQLALMSAIADVERRGVELELVNVKVEHGTS